jgi:hypothetical protein
MRLNNPLFNSRLRAAGYLIDNVNNVATLAVPPNATYPNVCGNGISHSPDLKISQTAATTVTRTSDTRLTAASGTPWTANVLVGQWAFAYVASTGLGSYVRISANTTSTIDTTDVFYAGCDTVRTSVWLPKTVVATNADQGFYAACFDGESIWFAPYTSPNVTKINVATGEKTVVGAHGQSSFIDCCFDGECVWFAPYNSTNFLKVNVSTNQIIVVGAHGEGSSAFRGCCFDGESVWFAPYTSTNFVKVNVATGVKTVVAAHGEGASAFGGCCFDGESVWFAPYGSSNFVKINTTTGIKTSFPHGEPSNPFYGCCFDGESVWFAPYGSTNFIKVNCATNTKIIVGPHGEISGPFYGCCFDGESVWFTPFASVNFVKVNVATGTKTVVGHSGESVGQFRNCCFDGESIWWPPVVNGNFVKTRLPRLGRASTHKPLIAGTAVLNDRCGIGVQQPSAFLHITSGSGAAGTTPLKLTSGSLMTLPESGSIEYDGTTFRCTGYDNVRYVLNAYTSSIPASSGSRGLKGQYSADVNALYVCYADNTWLKLAKSSW